MINTKYSLQTFPLGTLGLCEKKVKMYSLIQKQNYFSLKLK